MAIDPDSAALLDALAEPALLVRPGGTIDRANRAARAAFGEGLEGTRFSSLHGAAPEPIEDWLQRCLGSATPLVGALLDGAGDAPDRLQLRGSRVSLAEGPAVLVRITRTDEERFRALNARVADLDAKVKQRLHAEEVLKETLRERELLLRELQHRVKNNMHMLAGILHGAEREAESAEAKTALRDAYLRFSAVSAVQQLLYGSGDLDAIGSEALLATVAKAALLLAPGCADADLAVEPVVFPIDAAVPVALIANELLTNAVKYGRPPDGEQKIRVVLKRDKDRIRLSVADNGPGFDLADPAKRASGIGLVRGLLRQLGGSFQVEREGGARCTAIFPAPHRPVERSAA